MNDAYEPRDADSPDPGGGSGREDRALAALLLFLCVASAAAGILLASRSPRLAWLALAALTGSFGSLVILVRSLERGRSTRFEARLLRAISAHIRQLPAFGPFAVAVTASLAATWLSQSQDPALRGWPSFAAWMVGVVALGAFALREWVRSRPASDAAPVTRTEVAAVFVLAVLAFALRVVRLDDVPYPMSGDEASVGLEGMRILDGSSRDMFRTGWSLQPYLSFLGPAISMSVFGRSLTGLRLFPALAGTLTVPVLYFAVRSMFSRPVALLAAGLLATMAFHVHFSRIAVNNVDAAFLLCAVAGLLHLAAARRKPPAFIAAGLACGFTLFSFAGARLAFVLAFLFFSYLVAVDRELRAGWRNLIFFAVALAVVVLPTAVHFLDDPNVGFGRLRQMGVFQTGWLAQEAARTHQSTARVLARQAFDSVGIFVAKPAFSGFYNSPKPLLDPLWSIALVLGMMFSWTGLSERRYVLLNLWFWSVVVFGGALIIPPPAAERFLLAAPAVAVFVALGIWRLWSLVGKIQQRPRIALVGAVATALLLALSSLRFYFGEYTTRHYFTEANSEVGMELGRYLSRAPRVRYVYFTGLPRMWYRSLPSTDFLSGAVPGEDFAAGTVPDASRRPRPLLFVALPHLESDLAAVQRAYPGGRVGTIYRRPRPTEPLFRYYRLE